MTFAFPLPAVAGDVAPTAEDLAAFRDAHARAQQVVERCGDQLEVAFRVEGVGLDTWSQVKWVDAQTATACRDPLVNAAASRTKSLVFLCRPRFWLLARGNPDEAAAVLVHEYLHTRGLGEWPVDRNARFDSVAITHEVKLVRKACLARKDLSPR